MNGKTVKMLRKMTGGMKSKTAKRLWKLIPQHARNEIRSDHNNQRLDTPINYLMIYAAKNGLI